MGSFWRHPTLPLGVVLLVLGAGNWVVSRNKVLEYSERIRSTSPIARESSLEDFPRLTPRTNTALLERLHRGTGNPSVAVAKRDFYSLAESGGRFISVIGLLMIATGLLQRWRRHRVIRSGGGNGGPSELGGYPSASPRSLS